MTDDEIDDVDGTWEPVPWSTHVFAWLVIVVVVFGSHACSFALGRCSG
jgi:hypothetical protein